MKYELGDPVKPELASAIKGWTNDTVMSESAALTTAVNEAIRSEAIAWFSSPYCKIWPKDRSKGLVTPNPNYLQHKIQAVINRCEELGLPIRILGLKPRQRGSTTFFSAVDYCRLRRKSANACVIGGQLSQTNEVMGMLKTYNQNDRFNWGNTGEIGAKEGRWSNGSQLKLETAGDRLAGIGGTLQVLHATETARWATYGVANAAEVLANIVKCVPVLPDTMIILESTAEGAVGDFYQRWLIAIDAEDFLSGEKTLQPGQYVRVFAPWFEFDDSAMRLTEEQKREIELTLDAEEEYMGERELIEVYGQRDEDGVLRLGESVVEYDVWEQLAWRRYAIREECKRDRNIFDRDYPKDWQTAFQRSGGLVFNQTGLAKIRRRQKLVTPQHGIIEDVVRGASFGQATARRHAFRPSEVGEAKVTIFEKPIPGARYILAVDTMTGETQVGGLDPDRHSAIVTRAGYWDSKGRWNKMATAARVVPCRWDIDVLADAVWRLSRYYGPNTGCKIAIEMNQDRGLTELLKLKGADLYVREQFNQREQRMTKALGYQTNDKTRKVLIERLATLIREWDSPGSGIDIWCPHALDQCQNFVRKTNGREEAAEGWHDDDVIALALAATLIEHATTFHPDVGGFVGIPPEFRVEGAARKGSAYS